MSWTKFLNVSALLRGLVAMEEALDDLGRGGLDLAGIDRAGGAVDGEEVAFIEGLAATVMVLAL